MVRSASQSGSQLAREAGQGQTPGGGRVRSHRGTKRDSKALGGGVGLGGQGGQQQQGQQGTPMLGYGLLPGDQGLVVQPLEMTANRWQPVNLPVRRGAAGSAAQVELDARALVERKVKALLNKLTIEKFDSISDQIISWANKVDPKPPAPAGGSSTPAPPENAGPTNLMEVIRLVFEKATDEATFSNMYARLCRKMMEHISEDVQDETMRNPQGQPITGGQLFRKYLLNRCQEDFERGWKMREGVKKREEEKEGAEKKEGEGEKEEGGAAKKAGQEELYSDEYYAAQKIKRQGLGLVKFIGELFKLQMLTERIMHECITKLLSNVDNPEEEEIESLCQLLGKVGQTLDGAKSRMRMDVYFTRMKELVKSKHITSRMQYMLLVRNAVFFLLGW